MKRIWQGALSLIITFGLIAVAWGSATTYQYNDAASNVFNIQIYSCVSGPVYCTAMVLEDSSGNEKFTSGNAGYVQFPSAQAVSQSGSWTATVTQGTASNLNAEVVGAGTAGSPSGGVVSIQGVGSGTAVPISGAVSQTSGPWTQNITQIGSNAVVTGGTNGSLGVGGLAATGAAVAGDPVLVAGSDGTDARNLLTDTSGRPNVVGAASSGSAVAGNPVLIAGSDGTDARSLSTNASGQAVIVGAGTAGSGSGGVLSVQGIASGTNLNVAQATAGNLNATVVNAGTFAVQDATVEGAISSSVMQSNTKQVNGVTTSTGAGAVGTGSQRVAVGEDTNTIAGSAPGTAGTPSSNVVSIQGEASMTPVLVTPSAAADPCMSAAKTNFALASSSGNTQVVAGSASKKVYVCSISIIAASAAVINFIEGTGGACTTANEAAIIGSTTAASGMSVPANGGFTLGNGGGTVAVTATAANGICILQSGTVALAGNVTYVQQ